jgi:hypothetical protein
VDRYCARRSNLALLANASPISPMLRMPEARPKAADSTQLNPDAGRELRARPGARVTHGLEATLKRYFQLRIARLRLRRKAAPRHVWLNPTRSYAAYVTSVTRTDWREWIELEVLPKKTPDVGATSS